MKMSQNLETKNSDQEKKSPFPSKARKRTLLGYGAGTLLGTLFLAVLYPSCGKSSKAEPQIVGGFEVTDATAFGPLLSSTVALPLPHCSSPENPFAREL